MKLYKLYVRPHVEYGVQAWNPWTDTDKATIEKVQERALRYTSGLHGHSYNERLRETQLTTLEARRERGDMIQVWKYLHNKQSVDPSKLFTLKKDVASRETRSSTPELMLAERNFRGETRRHLNDSELL